MGDLAELNAESLPGLKDLFRAKTQFQSEIVFNIAADSGKPYSNSPYNGGLIFTCAGQVSTIMTPFHVPHFVRVCFQNSCCNPRECALAIHV